MHPYQLDRHGLPDCDVYADNYRDADVDPEPECHYFADAIYYFTAYGGVHDERSKHSDGRARGRYSRWVGVAVYSCDVAVCGVEERVVSEGLSFDGYYSLRANGL